ncbi:MAG: rhodanese-like domain-containing protein, partial [Planctomycetota bacterium]
PPPPTSTVSGPETTARPGPDPGQSTSAPTSEFAELTLAQVLEICADPNTQVGLNMFLDARKAEDFEAGHIPGARLCSYNDIQTYLPNVEPWLAMANRIVVYCIGPDCEDSHDLCRALTMFYNVPKEKLLLFKGGWQEWTANNLQAATGPE